jgi:hypothetical protein
MDVARVQPRRSCNTSVCATCRYALFKKLSGYVEGRPDEKNDPKFILFHLFN